MAYNSGNFSLFTQIPSSSSGVSFIANEITPSFLFTGIGTSSIASVIGETISPIINPTPSNSLKVTSAINLLVGGTVSSASLLDFVSYTGVQVSPTISITGSGNIGQIWGSFINPTVAFTGIGASTSNIYGLQVAGTYASGSSNQVGSVYGSNFIPSVSTTGTGTITNVYGSYEPIRINF